MKAFTLPPRGEHLIDIGGYALHAQSWGKDSPVTVVFEAGLASYSLHWLKVAIPIGEHARVMVYDRAGYGWSEPAPEGLTRDSRQLAAELYALLERMQLPAPYLLVGHSLGGFVLRCFVDQHPGLVAAVVLVDAVHEDEWSERFPLAYRLADRSLVVLLALLAHLSRLGLLAWLGPWRIGNSRQLPPAYQRLASQQMIQAAFLETARRELAAMPQSASYAEQAHFPDLPMLVIGRGQAEPLLPVRVERRLRTLQRKLSQLSPRARRLTASESRHDIHLERPGKVTEAILQLLS